jgi:hypothetical protein
MVLYQRHCVARLQMRRRRPEKGGTSATGRCGGLGGGSKGESAPKAGRRESEDSTELIFRLSRMNTTTLNSKRKTKEIHVVVRLCSWNVLTIFPSTSFTPRISYRTSISPISVHFFQCNPHSFNASPYLQSPFTSFKAILLRPTHL